MPTEGKKLPCIEVTRDSNWHLRPNGRSAKKMVLQLVRTNYETYEVHVYGLSYVVFLLLPLEERLLLLLPGEPFCLCFPSFFRRSFFFRTFVLCFFFSMYEHVVEHLPQKQHNQPCTNQQSKYVPTRARQRK